MNKWLGMVALLCTTLTPGWATSAPSEQWAKGDWWDVQMEQQAMQRSSAPQAWLPSFRLHFEVTERTTKEVRVEVRTVPENRFGEHLVLRYSPKGELLTGQVVEAERVTPLGEAGGFGVFGMLGREAFALPKESIEGSRGGARVASLGTKRLAMDAEGQRVQTWRADCGYWTRYECGAGLPLRATLTGGSWKAFKRGNGPGR